MIILGIDPGSHATGYGVIATGATMRRLDGGVIRPDRKSSLAERLKTIHLEISAVLATQRPDAMAVEALFNARNAHSSLVLGHARGVILLAGALHDLPVTEYAPREIKQALTGNGAASKEQVRFMVTRCLGLAGEAPTLDESDALAVALAHASRRRGILNVQAARGGGC